VQKAKQSVEKVANTAVSIVKGVSKTANVVNRILHPFKNRKKQQEEIKEESAVTEYLLDDEPSQE